MCDTAQIRGRGSPYARAHGRRLHHDTGPARTHPSPAFRAELTLLAANPGPRRSDVAHEAIASDAAADLWSGPALARAAKLSRELDEARQKLADLRQQLDEALKRD